MINKSNLRNKILNLLQQQEKADAISKSQIITKKVLKHPLVKKSKSFFIYVSFNKEVQTLRIIQILLQKNKTIAVPKIVKPGIMLAVQINKLEELKPGKYGILEPTKEKPYKKSIDLGIIPCVAVTKKLDRLGRGGGYYDKFLKKNDKMNSIALAFDFQIVKTIPTENHDKKVNFIITN